MSKDDPHGDRMKGYEKIFDHMIDTTQPFILRLDGRAFHTHTRDCTKPFDENLHQQMVLTTAALCEEISGTRFGYTQSDEISLLVWKTNVRSQPWFGGRIQKILSIAAALASNTFNDHTPLSTTVQFDARIMQVPLNDIPNYFWWRQKDAITNSISAMAQANFSHKELDKKSSLNMLQMLLAKGLDWEKCQPNQKHGVAITRHSYEWKNTFTNDDQLVTRHRWAATDIPKWLDNWDWFKDYLAEPVNTV